MKSIVGVLISWICVISLGSSDALPAPLKAEPVRMIVTTTIEGAGLLQPLLTALQDELDITVRAAVMGSGQALAAARRADADVLITHDPERELEFVDDHQSRRRIELMRNQFIIVGPPDDPAGVSSARSAAEAFARLARSDAVFVGRGDLSGTDQAEKRLWRAAGVEPAAFAARYRSAGVGMAAALRIADQMAAYTLTDPATFAQLSPELQLRSLYTDSGEPALHNTYSVIVVSPAGEAVARWLSGSRGRRLIAQYRVAGDAVFMPIDAKD